MSDEYRTKHTEPTDRFEIQARRSSSHYARRDGVEGFWLEPRWSVFLPHQCDEWDIAGEPYGDGERPSKEAALADLDAFIAELVEIRRRLVADEWGEDR